MAADSPASADLAGDLDALRRRLDEHAALLRKNQQALAELADSVGRLVTTQRKRERWINVNSFVAHVLFTLVLGGAFLTLYRSRADELVRGRDGAVSERDLARGRVKTLESELAGRQAAVQK